VGTLVRTPQKTHYVSVTKPNQLMLFEETVTHALYVILKAGRTVITGHYKINGTLYMANSSTNDNDKIIPVLN
jgi:hypothetical protein